MAGGASSNLYLAILRRLSGCSAGELGRMAPLHTACKKGDAAGVRAALAAGADVNVKDSGGNAPLVWATYSGSCEVLSLLLQHGADVDVRYKVGWTCAHIAARESALPVLGASPAQAFALLSLDCRGVGLCRSGLEAH